MWLAGLGLDYGYYLWGLKNCSFTVYHSWPGEIDEGEVEGSGALSSDLEVGTEAIGSFAM